MTEEQQTGKSVHELVAEVSKALGTNTNPVQFLAELMIGFDPRLKNGQLHNIVQRLSNKGKTPTGDDWLKIKELVLYTDMYSKAPVSLDVSIDATKKLMDFLYSKKRSTTIENQATIQAITSPLTEEEVDDFELWFINRF